jgi:hypothetical protein
VACATAPCRFTPSRQTTRGVHDSTNSRRRPRVPHKRLSPSVPPWQCLAHPTATAFQFNAGGFCGAAAAARPCRVPPPRANIPTLGAAARRGSLTFPHSARQVASRLQAEAGVSSSRSPLTRSGYTRRSTARCATSTT